MTQPKAAELIRRAVPLNMRVRHYYGQCGGGRPAASYLRGIFSALLVRCNFLFIFVIALTTKRKRLARARGVEKGTRVLSLQVSKRANTVHFSTIKHAHLSMLYSAGPFVVLNSE